MSRFKIPRLMMFTVTMAISSWCYCSSWFYSNHGNISSIATTNDDYQQYSNAYSHSNCSLIWPIIEWVSVTLIHQIKSQKLLVATIVIYVTEFKLEKSLTNLTFDLHDKVVINKHRTILIFCTGHRKFPFGM